MPWRYWFTFKSPRHNNQKMTAAVIAKNKEHAKKRFKQRFRYKRLPKGTKIEKGNPTTHY